MPFIWDDEQQGGVAAPPVSLPQPPQQPTTNGFVWDDQQPQLQVPEPLVADPTFGGRYVASQPSPEQRALMVQAGRVDPLGLAMNPVGLSALSLPTLPADNELATKVWKSSGKTWREMTDAERRQAVEMDTIDQAQTPEAKQRLIRDSVARDQELQPGYKIDQSKLPPKPAGTPVPIPQQVLDATFEQIQNLPDGPEKDRLIQAHATGQQLSAQARTDIAAAEARGTSTVQNEAAQSPRMQALSNLGGQNIGGDVARGVLLGLTGVGNTVTNVLLRTADKARRRLAAGEDGTQPVGQGIFGDADSYVNRRNDALEFGRQAMSANQGERSIFPASMVQNASETLTTIGAMDALGIPIIPGFAAQIADATYSDDRKKGLSEDKAAFHAAGTAALQSALMLMAGRAGKELGLIPREELMSPAMAKAAQDVFTKEGLGTATKNILFQGGEGAAIHIAQSAFDAATGARPDALDPENLWPEAGKAGFDWAALGVLGTAGHAGPEAVRSAWARALNKLPGAMSRAHAAEQRLIDQLASNRAISRRDLEAVGVSTRGYKPREFNALAEQYIQDQLMPREVQKQRQDYMEQQSKFIPAAMNRFTTLNPQMPGGPESFIAGPQGGAESFTVDRNTVLPEVPDAQGIGKQVEAGSEAQGAQGQESGGVRVRDDATSNGLEAGPQEVAQPKQPWEMTYDEVLKAVNPSNREELQAARPILAALYPEEIDNGPDQWGIRRAIEKGDELPRTPTVELSRRHRDAIRAALDAGLPVPENVLAEYPDLASSRAQSVQPTATDATVAPTQPQEPSNGSQEQAGQVGEEVQQVNAEGQGRQIDAQGQELLGGAVPKNPLVTEQQPVDQSPAVSAREPAKDFVASLAKPKKGERPRTLTADDFVRQVRVAATSPEEAESIIALASANAEYRNQSLDAWVGENIAGVEKTDESNSYVRKIAGALTQKNSKTRGEVQFIREDGRAIIRAFKGSQNVATLAHELGHVFRRTLLPEDMRIAERALGVKEGKKWTRPQEERFARHFERYLRDGVAPTKKLATVFEKFKNWLTTIYRNLAGGPLKDEIPPELRDVFDRMLGATDAQIAERNGGDASFDFGANELDTNGKASLKEADKGIAKLQRREMIGDELLAIWNELSDQDKVLTWESAKQTASDENYYKSSLKNEFDTLFNSSPEDEFQQIVTKQGKKIIRKVSNAGRASAQARMVEYNAGDSAQIPGFDKKVAGLDELPLMKGEAYARGNGSLEVGLFDILRGGGKQFDTTPPEDYLLNYLDEEYGRRQAQENPVGEDRGAADQGGSPAESGNGSVEVQPGAGEAAAAPAAPFELSREGSPDASPIVEAYQPERIAEAGPSERQPLLDGTPADMAPGTLEGQQGLFQAAGGTPTVEFPSSVKNASTAADREAMGLPPRPEVEPHTWPSADQEALATLYRDPQAGQKIVAELLQQEKPRPLNDNETFILSNHIVRLKNEINAIARQSADAEDAGDAQAVADLKERYDDLSQQLFDADRAAESTGTEQSRGLNARKALKNADYSLASMELRERVALGRPLTEDERKKLMERDRKRRRKLAEFEETETEAKQQAFEEASDKQRKRSRVKKEDWTPGDIDLTPESEQLDINRTVEQLARYYFRQGITDREENIMAVHDYLQPYLGEGWTLDNARDALSGYGVVRKLSDKAEDQWYRQTRREQQKVRKLIDMLAGRPPKITGTEREEPNQENRDLTKTVNNYKRFYNITSGDDASNARSALDAVKTRLNNEIRDLEKQIREKNKIIKRKNDIQYDTEANDLKAKRDALKAQFDEIFGKPEMTDAKRMELAMKAMERNMAELDRRIKERDFTVSTPRVFDSPEYRALKTKQDAMRAEYENLREYDPQYMEQQRQKRLAAVEARIADYEQQIATGNFATPAARKAVDLDLQAAQEVRDALRKRRNEVRKTDPEWMRQQQLKEARRLEVRLLKRAERLADRMGRQDYTSKPAERQHGPLDEKLSRLYDELNKMQREFDDHVYDVNLRGTLQARIADKKRQMDTKVFVDRPQREARPISPETKLLAAQAKIIDKAYERERQQYERTVIGHLWDATNLMRLFQTTGEYSPVLLQGGKEAAASLGGLAVGDVTTGKDFGTAVLRGFKAFASPEYAKAHDKALFENPRLPLWMDAGLRLILEGEHITPSEELEYSKKLLNHIPIARKIIPRFEDMARVFYNDMRTSAFDAMTIMKPDATPEQLHALARFANVSTGYSTLGSQGEAAAKAASVFLFSPRNLAANFRYAIFEPVMRGDAKGVRTIILKKYAKTLIGVAVAFGLAKLGGADISLDPSSPDFLKWKFGNTRLNPLAGLQQLFVMGYRSATGKTTSSDGNARNTDAYSVHAQFLRGKLAPQLALGYDLLAGKNVVGEPVNFDLTGDHFPYVLPNLLDRITPMTYSDVVKAIQEQGVPRGSAIGIAALFGMPTQTYQPKQQPGSPRNRAPRERRPKR